MQEFDLVVIGFGKAGKTLAGKAASLGNKVALIEKSDKMYGGTCINVGCIPTKSLVFHSHLSYYSKENPCEFYEESIHAKDKLINFLRGKNYDNLDQNENITIFDGTGSFVDSNTIEIKGIDNLQIKGKKIVINTGSETIIPPISISSERVYSSSQMLSLCQLPKHLVIIGGGYIGLEFASIYANFGSKITILLRGDCFMPKEDEDISTFIRETFESKGIEIIYNTTALSVKDEGEQTIITYKEKEKECEISCDGVLFATGRKPQIKDLNLQNAGINVGSKGEILVNEFLQTNVENIYAVGDVKGPPFFTYISLDDFRIVFSHLYKDAKRTTNNRTIIPEVLFLDTPLAHVGLREKEAKAKGYDYKVAKLMCAAIPRARILENTTGVLKIIINHKDNSILGATFYSVEAPEMINIISLAINNKISYLNLRDMIFTHPSMSEAINDLCALIG